MNNKSMASPFVRNVVRVIAMVNFIFFGLSIPGIFTDDLRRSAVVLLLCIAMLVMGVFCLMVSSDEGLDV